MGQNQFDKEEWGELREEFNYPLEKEKAEQKPKASNDRYYQKPESTFGIPTTFLYVLVGIISILLAFIAFKMIAGEPLFGGAKLRKRKALLLEIEEDLENADVDSFLKDAIANQDWDLAVRLLYLTCLKTLSSEGFVRWKRDKTNFEYLMDLGSHPSLRKNFEPLTRMFELVCYGERHVDREVFEAWKPRFMEFLNRLNP